MEIGPKLKINFVASWAIRIGKATAGEIGFYYAIVDRDKTLSNAEKRVPSRV